MMTMKERLLAPFRGIHADRPAWVADLSYWYDAAAHSGTLPREYRGRDGYKRLHADLGVGYYYDYESRLFDPGFEGVELIEHQTGTERSRQWRTSTGSLSEHWCFLESAACWARDKYAVTSERDLPILRDICDRMRFTPTIPAFRAIAEWIGECGVPLAPAPRSPLPALLTDWCGVERTIYFLMDIPDTMRAIMESIDRANDAAFEITAAAPCELVHFCDNLDSSTSTPFFGELMRDYYSRRLRQLHAAGKHAVVHLDGRVRGLLPLLASCGFDGVEALTPAPVGDVAIEDLREVASNPRTILWGGIPGAMFCPPWTRAQICDHARRLLECHAGGNRLVVGSADQVPPNGNLDFCAAIAETIERSTGGAT
jgi:uroporphyrinogen-III decarboxylase